MLTISPATPPASPTRQASPAGPAAVRVRGRRVVPLTVLAVTAAGLLAACASTSTHSAASAAGGTATAGSQTPGTATSAASAGAGVAGSGSSGTPGLAVCRSASLRVSVNVSQAGGAAGSTYYPVDFTNTSSSACGMYGYPGLSFVTAAGSTGRQIGAAAQRNPQFGKQPVRLVADGVAHAWLQVAQAANYPASACQPMTAHWLRVFAPGETVASYVNEPFDACSSANAPLLTVMPVRAGQGVQGTTP